MIEKSVLLPCAPNRAFVLFTQEISAWWPPARRHTNDPESAIFLLESGRFYERSRDGVEVELGRVHVWEPGERLVLDFYPGTDADHPTKVTITFTTERAGTRVSVQHVPKAESEALWKARAPRYEASWDLVLAALLAAA